MMRCTICILYLYFVTSVCRRRVLLIDSRRSDLVYL